MMLYVLSTQHLTGLNIAVAHVQALWENGYKDKIHFDVYSSFEAYGWKRKR